MLRPIQTTASILLLIGFISLFGVAIHNDGVYSVGHQQRSKPTAQSSTKESTQDIAAETVAYYTKVLAWFTAVLAVASLAQGAFLYHANKAGRISAEAAKQASDALPVVERAYVYPIIVSTGAIAECIRQALVFYLDPAKSDVPAEVTTEITFKIKNYGKTPAILKTIYAGVGIAPITTEIGLSIPDAILGEMETTGGIRAVMEIGLTRNQAMHVQAYTAALAFSGQITFDDIWGLEHTTKFIFVWDKDIECMALRGVETTHKKSN